MKPKCNYKGIPKKDRCQTPPYALRPLYEYIESFRTIWEPACGERYLSNRLLEEGFDVIATDIIYGQDFFSSKVDYDIIITNPPYSIKYKWLERCYLLGRPFALLLPLESLGAYSGQKLFREHGMQLIVLNKRVNFKMPNKGWTGAGAQFPVAWFTWHLELGSDLVYGTISPRNMKQLVMY